MKESVVLAQCKYILRWCSRRKLLAYRRIHTMGIPNGRGGYRRNTDMVGMSDLEIYLPKGRLLVVETKSTKGRLSEEQKAWRDELTALGHRYELVNHVDELIALLRDEGISELPFRT